MGRDAHHAGAATAGQAPGPLERPARLDATGELYVFRLHGAMPLARASDAVSDAIAYVLTAGGSGLLVDAGELVLAAPPSVGARLEFVRAWADAAQGRLRLAVAAPAALIDPERVGVVAGAGYGLQSGAFDSYEDALGWLRDAQPR